MSCMSTACHAEGVAYPMCLCTETGRLAIRESDRAAWLRMFGHNGTQIVPRRAKPIQTWAADVKA